MDKNSKNPRILFHAGNSYSFRSWPIWQFYEVCQKYPTVLLCEGMDSETEKIILNKEFFPNLEKIIVVRDSSDSSTKQIIQNNKFFYGEAKRILNDTNPDIVITIGKNVYTFCLYLRRLAKKRGVKNICILYPQDFPTKEISLRARLYTAFLVKSSLPFGFKVFLSDIKKTFGHFLYYWLLPLTVLQSPFLREPGMRFGKNVGESADYYVVFSKGDYDVCISEGMPKRKLKILANPYPVDFSKVEKPLLDAFANSKREIVDLPGKKIVWMYPNAKAGFTRDGHKMISSKEVMEDRKEIADLISKSLSDWKVIIKPHPHIQPAHLEEVKKFFSVYENFVVVDPKSWAEGYIYISDMILGFPPRSLTLYTASLMYPEKVIVSFDLRKEVLGGTYKYSPGIEYIDSKEKFETLLKSIQDGRYNKELSKKDSKEGQFDNFNAIVKDIVK